MYYYEKDSQGFVVKSPFGVPLWYRTDAAEDGAKDDVLKLNTAYRLGSDAGREAEREAREDDGLGIL